MAARVTARVMGGVMGIVLAGAVIGCASSSSHDRAKPADIEAAATKSAPVKAVAPPGPATPPAAPPKPVASVSPSPEAAAPSSAPFKIAPVTSVFDPPSIEIQLDYADAPDLKEWAEKAKAIGEAWYPKICAELASEGFDPPTKTKITFDPQMRGVAHTSRGQIRASAAYVRDHQDDYGMIVHELVHVVQSYPNRPKRAPGWVVEGIADYIRFHQYEPGTDRSRINPDTASYRDSYRTTARFLAWVVETHDKAIVQKLNSSLRAGECDEETTKTIFGGDIDRLWRQFIDNKVRKQS